MHKCFLRHTMQTALTRYGGWYIIKYDKVAFVWAVLAAIYTQKYHQYSMKWRLSWKELKPSKLAI